MRIEDRIKKMREAAELLNSASQGYKVIRESLSNSDDELTKRVVEVMDDLPLGLELLRQALNGEPDD